MRLPTLAISLSLALAGAPLAAQELPTPAQAAQPVNAGDWWRTIDREIQPDLRNSLRWQSPQGLRFALLVGQDGDVIGCRALPMAENQPARGADICPLMIEHAEFAPALDENGEPLTSVFVAQFGSSHGNSAAEGSDIPPI